MKSRAARNCNDDIFLEASLRLTNETAPFLKQVAILKGHDGAINTLTWSPDGRFIATGSDDATVMVWNAATNLDSRPLTLAQGSPAYHLISVIRASGPVRATSWSRDGSRLAFASLDPRIFLWDATTRQAHTDVTPHPNSR